MAVDKWFSATILKCQAPAGFYFIILSTNSIRRLNNAFLAMGCYRLGTLNKMTPVRFKYL